MMQISMQSNYTFSINRSNGTKRRCANSEISKRRVTRISAKSTCSRANKMACSTIYRPMVCISMLPRPSISMAIDRPFKSIRKEHGFATNGSEFRMSHRAMPKRAMNRLTSCRTERKMSHFATTTYSTMPRAIVLAHRVD